MIAKYRVLNHLTFIEDISSIKRYGLIPRKKYSKYGNPPVLDAVYLYHKSSKGTVEDFKKTFPNRRIINIEIDANRLDPKLFRADEDYYRYPHKRKIPSDKKMKEDAIACLKTRGTIAYIGIIPPDYFMTIKEIK